MQQNEFQHIPATFWVYILLPFTVIAVALAGLKTHNPFMFGLIGVIPFCILLLNRIDLWLVTIFAVYNSSLRIPGVVLGELELVHVLMAGLIGVVFLRFIIAKKSASRKAWMWKSIYAFAAVLLVTMAVRGAGFQLFGDSSWGGMRYVVLLLTLAFPFVVTNLHLTPRQWRTAIISMSLLALLPFAADTLFVVSRGVIYHHYYLVKVGTVASAFQSYGTEEMTRFRSGAASGWALMLLPFFLFPAEKRNILKYLPFIVVGLGLAAISGHRLAVLSCIGFLWMFGFSVARGRRMGYLVATVVVSFLVLGVLVLVAPHLPYSVQRTVSFIPFLDIEPTVVVEANSTLRWRWMVWKDAIQFEVPEFLLLGKGYAYDGELLESQTMNRTALDWARITVAYHSGPLSLLIGLGALGLVTGMAVIITAIVRHHRFSEGRWYDERLKQFHHVCFIVFSLNCFKFVFVYGDVHVSFPGLFKYIALMEGLALANQYLRTQQEETADAQPDAPEVPKLRKISLGI